MRVWQLHVPGMLKAIALLQWQPMGTSLLWYDKLCYTIAKAAFGILWHCCFGLSAQSPSGRLLAHTLYFEAYYSLRVTETVL